MAVVPLFRDTNMAAMASRENTRSGARFSKVPKLFGRISGYIILFVSSERRRLEARNFAFILIFIPFTTYEKTGFPELAEWLFGPEKFSGLSRNGPLARVAQSMVSTNRR